MTIQLTRLLARNDDCHRFMKILTRYVIALVLMVNVVVVCVVAQSQTKANKKTPSGQVSGSVTIRGKPAPGIVVAVRTNDFNPSSGPLLKATTDEDGHYKITGIPSGTHLIVPIASALVTSETASYGQSGRTVVIAENENVDDVDFTLVRGAVITGKVTDANGRPVIEEQVNLMSVNQNNQRGISYPVLTDDRGIYRMYGLLAGKYKVSVGQAEDDDGGGPRGRTPYRRTFFPDATDPVKAEVIEVAEGAEAANIDITVEQKVLGFSTSGRIVDEAGKPVPNMALNLSRIIRRGASTSSSGGGTGVLSDRQGEFKIPNLVAGHYTVSVSPAEPVSDLRADSVAFDIRDQDVTGLLIKVSSGASVSGVVVLEGLHDEKAAAKLAQLYIGAYVEDGDNHSGRGSEVKADGSFRIGGLPPGTANFSLGGGDLVRALVISRIERDGVAQPNGIQIQNGEHLTGVKIIVAHGTSTIRGVVRLENGPLPAGGHLLIHLTKPGDPSFSGGAGPDSRGRFAIEGLVAGNYEVTAFVYAPVPTPRRLVTKQLVSVAEGTETEVTLTIDLKQNPAPTPGRP